MASPGDSPGHSPGQSIGKERTFLEHTQTLRRLSADISRFRSGDVQAALATTPVRGNADAPSPLPESSPAALHAALLATRAELAQAISDREAADRARIAADSRASSSAAEAAVALEKLARGDAEAGLQRKTAADEIARLERERIMLAKDSAEKTELLRKMEAIGSSSGLDGGAGKARVSPEDPTLYSRYEDLVALCARQQRQIEAAQNETRLTRESHEREAESITRRAAELEVELDDCRRKQSDLVQEKAALMREHAHKESNMHAELVAVKADLAVRVADLAKLRSARVAVEEKLFDAGVETRRLQAQLQEAKDSSQNFASEGSAGGAFGGGARGSPSPASSAVIISTLRNEVAKLSKWVRAISPSGSSLEEGLAVLEKAASERENSSNTLGKESDLNALSQKQQAAAAAALQQQHRVALARVNAKVSALNKRLETAERSLLRAGAERDEFKQRLDRSERLRHMLERKGRHLKLMIDEIESGIEAGRDDEQHTLTRLQNRVKALDELLDEYKKTAEKYGEELQLKEEKIRSLSIDVASRRAQVDAASKANNEVTDLRAQLLKTIREATEAKATRDDALSQVSKLEEQLRSSERAGEKEVLDYDPQVLKVVRLKGGFFPSVAGGSLESAAPVAKRRRVDESAAEGVSVAANETLGSSELERRVDELERKNHELKKLTKVGERTVEVAKRKIEEVRQACLSLFGWTMRIQGATYRLSSIYADRRDDELVFGAGQNGAMTLHANEYSQRIDDEVEQFVRKWDSVPALLSSVTMSNFEKTTVVTG